MGLLVLVFGGLSNHLEELIRCIFTEVYEGGLCHAIEELGLYYFVNFLLPSLEGEDQNHNPQYGHNSCHQERQLRHYLEKHWPSYSSDRIAEPSPYLGHGAQLTVTKV